MSVFCLCFPLGVLWFLALLILGVFLSFFFFFLFRAAPAAHGGSQARGQIGATAAALYHSHSNTRSEPNLRLTPQLMTMPDP